MLHFFHNRKKILGISDERKRSDWRKSPWQIRRCTLWMLDDGVSRLTLRSWKRGCKGRGEDSPSSLPDHVSWRAYTYVPSTTILSFHYLRRRRRHDPFLRYRQSSTRNEARGGEAEPSLCRLTRSLLNYYIKTIRYSSALNIFTKVPLCSFSRVR